MAKNFTPTNPVDMAKERDWAANLGMMDWDNTHIIFTKRTLLQFLKYTGTTVDTNFSNISKLPRYATFGKFSDGDGAVDPNVQAVPTATQKEAIPTSESQPMDTFKPSRKVRTAPGGTSSGLFDVDDEEADDALSRAPPDERSKVQTSTDEADTALAAKTAKAALGGGDYQLNTATGIRPSRRVRTAPGGKDSLAGGLWGDYEEPKFKPSRKVRQGPGGQDSISSLLN